MTSSRPSSAHSYPVVGLASSAMTTVEPERVIAEMRAFLTGSLPEIVSDRALATMLFVDIVDSTALASRLGDGPWRDLLDRHYAAVERNLAAYRGVGVDRAGDGLLATFDGPTRAIRAAARIRAENDVRLSRAQRLYASGGLLSLVAPDAENGKEKIR